MIGSVIHVVDECVCHRHFNYFELIMTVKSVTISLPPLFPFFLLSIFSLFFSPWSDYNLEFEVQNGLGSM